MTINYIHKLDGVTKPARMDQAVFELLNSESYQRAANLVVNQTMDLGMHAYDKLLDSIIAWAAEETGLSIEQVGEAYYYHYC